MDRIKKPAYRLIAILLLLLLATLSFITLTAFPTSKSLSTSFINRTRPDASAIPDSDQHLRSITTRFEALPALEDMSHAADHAWSAGLLTPRGGFLRVRYNDTYEEPWGISMFHALHCLQLIRSSLVNAKVRLAGEAAASVEHVHGGGGHDHGGGGAATKATEVHVGHCFAYIAQSLICAGDGTIEPPWRERDEQGHIVNSGVDGENYEHQCVDASLLWDAAEQSERRARLPWGWKRGDTIRSVFGSILEGAQA